MATNVGQKIELKKGNDISIGDVAAMDVSMVKVVEPAEEVTFVTKFLKNRAEYHLNFLKASILMGNERNRESTQVLLNEITGIFIVLNETDTASVEVLLTAQPCLLSKNDFYFGQMVDPCESIAKESFSKIIERFDTVEYLKTKLTPWVKISTEWNSHWRQIVMVLEPYARLLDKNDAASWIKIKNLVHDNRFV